MNKNLLFSLIILGVFGKAQSDSTYVGAVVAGAVTNSAFMASAASLGRNCTQDREKANSGIFAGAICCSAPLAAAAVLNALGGEMAVKLYKGHMYLLSFALNLGAVVVLRQQWKNKTISDFFYALAFYGMVENATASAFAWRR